MGRREKLNDPGVMCQIKDFRWFLKALSKRDITRVAFSTYLFSRQYWVGRWK